MRNDLHFRNERSNDVLLKAVQPAVARAMGFHDGSPRKRVDRLMRAYYDHVRNIHDLTRNVEQRLALLPQPGRLPRLWPTSSANAGAWPPTRWTGSSSWTAR